MASKAKEKCGLGKERKITISIPNTPTKRTPKSSPRSPSTDHKQPFSSSSSSSTPHSTLSEKPVPNYLKFTASSRPDHASLKPIKKPSSPAPTPGSKPSLNRRRSFDKPPPTTPRLDKPFRSPGPRSSAAHVPVRSSSFGVKPSTTIISSPKPSLLERSSSKVSKLGGGKQQNQVQSLKSSITVKKSLKRESSNAAASPSAAAEMVSKTKDDVEYAAQSPSFVLGMSKEDLKKLERELDPCLPDPMPELDKEEADRTNRTKLGGGKQQNQVQSLKSSVSVKKSLKRESSNAVASPSAAAEMVSKTKDAVEYAAQSPSFVLGMSKEDLKKLERELDPCLPDQMPELDKEEADRTNRTKLGGGKQHNQVQSLKSSVSVKKSLKRESNNVVASPSAAAEMVSKTKDAVEYAPQSPSFVLGMSKEDLKKLERELDPCLPDPMPELDKEEVDRKDEAENKLHHHHPPQDTEIFKVVDSNKQANETPQGADANSSIGEEANGERNEGEREEGSKEKEEVVASEESTYNKNEEKIVIEEEEAQDEQSYKEENHNSTTKAETTEKEVEAAEKVAAEKAAAPVGKPRQGGPERKESPAMYNHVIEETTTKLMEERKNKVRALAGAFQTVIDYESSSK